MKFYLLYKKKKIDFLGPKRSFIKSAPASATRAPRPPGSSGRAGPLPTAGLKKSIFCRTTFPAFYPMRVFRDGQMWPFCFFMSGDKHQSRLMPVAMAPQLKVGILRLHYSWVLICVHQFYQAMIILYFRILSTKDYTIFFGFFKPKIIIPIFLEVVACQ
jgi:hypothetical protein